MSVVKEKYSFPLRLAAIDAGSNGLRFIAAEFTALEQYRVLASERVSVRLGTSAFRDQKISQSAMTAAVAAIGRFHVQMRRLQVEHYRAIATSAVRDSSNGAELTRRIKKRWQLDLEIISGSEESRLVYQAVKRRLPLRSGPWLIVNLGGGSVEIALVNNQGLIWSESHTLGAVRLLQEFRDVAPQGEHYRKLLSDFIRTMQLRQPLPRLAGDVIMTGGNIEVLAKLGKTRMVRGIPLMRVVALGRLVQELGGLNAGARRRTLGLKPDRADVILPAAMVYEHIAGLAGRPNIWIPGVGTKEGILYDLAESLTATAGRSCGQHAQVMDACIRLGRRYGFDEAHGLQVARLALTLFTQLGWLHHLGEQDQRLLQAAAILHDVGMHISYKKHHKHSLYVIANSELPGFTPGEMLMVANIARYHRKKGPQAEHEFFHRLSRPDQTRVLKLAALLRIADALDREHVQAVRQVRVVKQGRGLQLHLEGRGLALEQWAVARKMAFFKTVYKCPILVVARRPARPESSHKG